MSYILDALRKSDQQRQRGAAPRLLAARASVAAPKRPAFWLYGLFAVVLLGAGIGIGSLRPWQTDQPEPQAETVPAQPLEPRSPQAAPGPASPAVAAKPEGQAPVRKSEPPAAARSSEKPEATAEPKREAREVAAEAPRERPAPVQTQPVASTQAAAEPKLVALSDLPLAIQQELPSMAISVHAYSGNPRERLVGINNRMLREGDFVQPGLELERITPDGMIFSYKGYRFVRGVR